MTDLVPQIKKNIKENGGKDKITELNLTGMKFQRFTPEITAVIQECKKLENLILSQCDLVSLEGMPKLDLSGIDLTSNKLTDGQIKHLKIYPKLFQLLLTDNQIQNVDSIKQLSACKDLSEMDISGNPIADKPDYRSSIFESIKSLEALDGKDADGKQLQEEQQLGDDDDDDDDDDDQFQGDDDDQEYDEDEESEDPKPKKNTKKGGK